MSRRRKAKVQYGTPSRVAPGGPPTGGTGLIAVKIAIGAVFAVLLTIIVVPAQDEGGKTRNIVAFQPATVTGDPLPPMPSEGASKTRPLAR